MKSTLIYSKRFPHRVQIQMLCEILEVFGSTLSGAGGGASIGGPYGAAFGAVLGAAGWMGNKQYEEDQKPSVRKSTESINSFCTVMAEQQIQTYAFNLADTIDSLVELRSKIQSTILILENIKCKIAQVKKEKPLRV